MNRLPRWLIVALAVGPAVGLLVFYAWPLVTLVTEAVTATSTADTLTRASTWEVLWFTTWQAVASTVAAGGLVSLGTPLRANEKKSFKIGLIGCGGEAFLRRNPAIAIRDNHDQHITIIDFFQAFG